MHTDTIFSFFLMDYTDSGWNGVNILHSGLYSAVLGIYDQIRVDITLVLCCIKLAQCQSFLFFPLCALSELRQLTWTGQSDVLYSITLGSAARTGGLTKKCKWDGLSGWPLLRGWLDIGILVRWWWETAFVLLIFFFLFPSLTKMSQSWSTRQYLQAFAYGILSSIPLEMGEWMSSCMHAWLLARSILSDK